MFMKKRLACFMLVITMLLVIPVCAISDKLITVYPELKFNGTEATCTVRMLYQNSDKITPTMSLWSGKTLIDEWSASGSGFLAITGTATVAKNKTYTLTVEYTVNGESQTPVSTTRTNN